MSRTSEDKHELAVRYAPSLFLHPEDKLPPANPLLFIDACELRYEGGFDDPVIVFESEVEPERLGQAAGSTAYPGRTLELGRSVYAWEFTRPFSKGDIRERLDEASGFALKRKADVQKTPLDQAPMFYEWRDDKTLIYWFFMSGSALPQNIFETLRHWSRGQESTVPETEYVLGLPSWKDEVHQGDWEGATFTFRDDANVDTITLHQHGEPALVCYADLASPGGHVELFCALDSHATLGSADDSSGEVARRDEAHCWRPARENILDVTAQPWYGFGGAWGQTRGSFIGRFRRGLRERILSETQTATDAGFDVWEEATGPLGPSCYKTR
jgi:hypothetical protein